MPQIGYAHRQAPMARDGMVASCHPLASLVGVEVLKSGGNVVDAAIATNGVLSVTQPNYCGLGGDFFCLYYEAQSRRVHFLNGAGRSGSRAGLEELKRRGLAAVPLIGRLSVVPGDARVVHAPRALRHAPAQDLSSRPPLRRRRFSRADRVPNSRALGAVRRSEWRRVFVPGAFPEPGDVFRNPSRAHAERAGGHPDLFYRGGKAGIAKRLERDGSSPPMISRRIGEWESPSARVSRLPVWETPPPTQGIATLLTLNLLEASRDGAPDPLRRAPPPAPRDDKIAYADRDRWVADPTASRVPVEALLDKAYAARRRVLFDPDRRTLRAGRGRRRHTGFVLPTGAHVLSVIQSIYKASAPACGAGHRVVLKNRGPLQHESRAPELLRAPQATLPPLIPPS